MIIVCQKVSSIRTVYKLFFFSVHGNWKKENWISYDKLSRITYLNNTLAMIWVSVTVLTYSHLPWKYVFVRRKATASLKIDKRSNFDKILDSKGNKEAKWSSSPFNRSLWRFEGLLLVSLLGSFGGGLKLKFRKVYIITYVQIMPAFRLIKIRMIYLQYVIFLVRI